MNELLDRIAAALEKQNDISAQNVALFAKSVALQEEGCQRNREMHALYYEHSLLSIERHHLLRMKEFLSLFAIGGADRSDIFPVVHAAYEKWKLSVEDINPNVNIGFGIIENIYQNDLKTAQNMLLEQLEQHGVEAISKEILSVLELVNNYLAKKSAEDKQKEEETPVRDMTLNFVQDLIMNEPPRSIATSVDFGIPESLNPQYGALQWGLKNEMFTAQELDDACCSGPKLTALVARGENPYKCEFHTTWDDMPDEEEEEEEEEEDTNE